MSRHTAHLPSSCYEARGFDWEQEPLARPSKEIFVENLAHWMGKRGLKQTQLADAVGVHRAVVHGWVTGRAHPEAKYYDAIADALDIPVASLFEDPTDSRTTGLDIDKAIRMVTEAAKKGSS